MVQTWYMSKLKGKYRFSVCKIGGKTSKVLLSVKTVFQHFYQYSDWFWYESSLFGQISHSHKKNPKISRMDAREISEGNKKICIWEVHESWNQGISFSDFIDQDV